MVRFFTGFGYAFRGIYITFRSERNFKIHIIAMLLSIALGLFIGLSLSEWGFVIFAIGFVMVSELFNTAVERLSDKIASGEQNQLIRMVKDISAGGVLLSALTALAIGIIFLFIPLWVKIFG